VQTLVDAELRDEYVILERTAVLSDVAKALLPVKNSAALIRGKKKEGIVGILKVQPLLEAMAESADPTTSKAIDVMETNLLRLKDSTPIQIAVTTIQDRNPDATIVLDDEGKFQGYLSASDYRDIKQRLATPTLETRQKPRTISDAVTLRDEFRIVKVSDKLQHVALQFRRPSVQYVLAQSTKGGIEGVFSVQHMLKLLRSGAKTQKDTVKKHMKTNLLRLRHDTPIEVAIETIRERRPDGVLVLNEDGVFEGFLSPDDFRELTKYIVPDIQHDGTFDSLMPFFIERISQGNGFPMVLTHTGSNIAIHDARANVEAQTHVLVLNLDVSTVETGKTSLQFKFDLGHASSMSHSAKALRDVEAPPILQHVWGDLLIHLSWLMITQWMDAGRNDSSSLLLYGMDENGKLIFEELKRDSGDDF